MAVPPLHFGADLLVQLAQAAVGVVVEIAAEHERAHEIFEFVAALRRQRAALEPRIALPRAALADEVFLEERERAGERTGIAVGAQAHVDAEHESLRGGLANRRDHRAAEFVEVLLVADHARAGRLAVLGEREYQIDVGRYVEFAAAQLSHADHDQRLALAGRRARFAERLRKPSCVVTQRRRNRAFGECGDRRDHLLEIGQPAQVAREDAQHDALAQHPQRVVERLLVGRVEGERAGHVGRGERSQDVIREPGCPGRMAFQESPNVMAVERGGRRRAGGAG